MRAPHFAGIVIAFGLTALAAAASAEPSQSTERPRGTYVIVDESSGAVIQNHAGSHILFLNGCHEGGCTITPGGDDSRNNRSSIINSTSNLPPWAYGDASWNTMVDCVKDLYSPFDVIVTDIDPGPDTPHYEAMVSGGPADIGMQQGVGGVSPFTCGIIENAITYTFPEAVGNQPQIICEIVGQESAHAFGLDHEYLCEDPMTYLNGCGDKAFRDIDAECGEFSPRNCQCGGATQNSFQRIKAIFGDAIPPTPPEVSIESPSNNGVVRPGFTVVVEATDDVEVKRVEVLIDGDSIGARTEPPYEFSAPGDLFTANVEIEARAFDDRGTMGTDTVAVTVGDPCSSTNECGAGEACVDGRCVPFEVDGGLGEECTMDVDCASGICVEELGVCTELCDPAADGCPFGFDCTEVAGGGGACFRGEGDGGDCGCRVGGHSKLPMAPLALLALLFVVRRRRRAR